MAEHCSRLGQTELAALFDPAMSLHPLSVGKGCSRGSVLPVLDRARRLYSQESDHEAAAKVLLEMADTFRKSRTPLLFYPTILPLTSS